MQFVVSEDTTVVLNGERYLLEKGDIILVEEVRGIKELKQYDMTLIGKIGMFRVWISKKLRKQPKATSKIIYAIETANNRIAQLGVTTTVDIAFLTPRQFKKHATDFGIEKEAIGFYSGDDHIIVINYGPFMLYAIIHEMSHHIYKNMSPYAKEKLHNWIDKNIHNDYKEAWDIIENRLLESFDRYDDDMLEFVGREAVYNSQNVFELINNIIREFSGRYLRLPDIIPSSLNRIAPKIEKLEKQGRYAQISEVVRDWLFEHYKTLELDKKEIAYDKYSELQSGKSIDASKLPSPYAMKDYQEFFSELFTNCLIRYKTIGKFSRLHDLFRELSTYL